MKDYTEELEKLLKAKYEDVAVLEFDESNSVEPIWGVTIEGVVEGAYGTTINKVRLRVLTSPHGVNQDHVVAIIDKGEGHEFRIDEYTPDFIVTFLGSILGKITHKLVPVEAQQ